MKKILLPLLFAGFALRLAAAAPATNGIPVGHLLITCDAFEFSSSNKVAIYTGHVRVVDPPANTNEAPSTLTCKILTVTLPESGGKIQNIIATGDVVIDQGDNHATGEKAIYRAETDVLELSGNPILVTTNGTLYADLVLLDRRTNKLKATGQVRMIINQGIGGTNGGGLMGPNFLSPKPTNAVPVKKP